MTTASSDPQRSFRALASGVIAAGLAVTVGTALAFQHLWGYMPCKLCLEQRIPYYVAIPVALAALAAALVRAPALVTRGLLAVIGLAMVWSLYLAGFHAGVEWGWWPGPTDCGVVPASVASGGTGGILDQLDAVVPPSCDVAAGRFLGLSFAGWNFLASLGLAGAAFTAAARRA